MSTAPYIGQTIDANADGTWVFVLGEARFGASFTSLDDLDQRLLDFIEYFDAALAEPFRWTTRSAGPTVQADPLRQAPPGSTATGSTSLTGSSRIPVTGGSP